MIVAEREKINEGKQLPVPGPRREEKGKTLPTPKTKPSEKGSKKTR